jgi:hypothetical protein
MLNLTTYIIASFATYYLALSIAREDGPFGVFLALRNAHTEDDWVGRGLRCIVCLSCWTGLLWAVLLALLGAYDVWYWPIVWLALAGAAVVIDRYWRR